MWFGHAPTPISLFGRLGRVYNLEILIFRISRKSGNQGPGLPEKLEWHLHAIHMAWHLHGIRGIWACNDDSASRLLHGTAQLSTELLHVGLGGKPVFVHLTGFGLVTRQHQFGFTASWDGPLSICSWYRYHEHMPMVLVP